MSERAKVEVKSRSEWRAWLEKHHAQKASIWLVTYKKAAGDAYLPYNDIVEEALAFGWVDSQPKALDANRSMRLLAPRKTGSGWSSANKKRIAQLEECGAMTAAGRAVVERAKKDGSWNRNDGAQKQRMPKDLATAFTSKARENFNAFPPSTKRAIYEWIGSAKTAETREKRISETAEKAVDNIRANQWRQPKHR